MAGYWKKVGAALLGLPLDYARGDMGDAHQNGRMKRSIQYGSPVSISDPDALYKLFGISDTDAGWSLTKAEALPAAYACQAVLARDISRVKFGLFSRDDLLERITSHPANGLIGRKPDKYLTISQWLESMILNALRGGDAYAQVIRDGRYQPSRLRLWRHNEVGVVEDAYGDISYTTPINQFVPYEDMIHFKFNSIDGKRGRTPLRVCSDMFSEGIAMLGHGKNFYQNGAKIPGFLKVPRRLEDMPDETGGLKNAGGARERLRNSFQTVTNSGQIPILEEDTEFVPVQMNFGDVQFMQMREMGFYDTCSVFGVPPTIVQRYGESKYATSEQADLSYVKHTLAPYVEQIEQELEEKLLNMRDVKIYQVKGDLRSLMKGDIQSQKELYEMLLDKQVYTRNDVRKELGDAYREGYNEHMIPAGMMTETVHEAYYGDKVLDSSQSPADARTDKGDTEKVKRGVNGVPVNGAVLN